MHRVQPAPTAPTAPFPVGEYLVIPGPLRHDTNNTCYRITRNGRDCGAQISRPNLEQCRDRERETIAQARRPSMVVPRFNNSAPPMRCATCFIEKPASAFYKKPGRHGRRSPHCKRCIESGLAKFERHVA